MPKPEAAATSLSETTLKTLVDGTSYQYGVDVPLTHEDVPWQSPSEGAPIRNRSKVLMRKGEP
jgi:hypothetical protein